MGRERPGADPLRLSVPVRRLATALAVVIIVLSAVSLAAVVIADFVIVDNKYVDRIVEWIDVNREGSIPTWYATITLASCAVMLGIIAVDALRHAKPYPFHWAALGVIFALLSLEEILGVHSEVTGRLRDLVSITDGPGYAIALGLIALAGLAIAALIFGRFYMHLPSRWRTWFTIAVVIYAIGVFASDAIGDYLITAAGEPTLAYDVVLTIEETLEMTGVLIFIVMLLEYIRTFVGTVSFTVTDLLGT